MQTEMSICRISNPPRAHFPVRILREFETTSRRLFMSPMAPGLRTVMLKT